MPGRLLEAASLEIAKDHRRPKTLGQLFDFLMEHFPNVVALHGVRLWSRGGRELFMATPASRAEPRA